MITTAALIETIREANGQDPREIVTRINAAADKLGIEPADRPSKAAYDGDYWHDDDADEICMAITR